MKVDDIPKWVSKMGPREVSLRLENRIKLTDWDLRKMFFVPRNDHPARKFGGPTR